MAEQFAALLETLASPDNDTRNRGEAQYNTIPVEQRIDLLIQSIEGGSQATLRSFAAILLRRLLTSNWDVFAACNDTAKDAFKTSLLKILQQEKDESCRRKICDTVSEVARNFQDEEGNMGWDDLLKFMFQCCKSGDPQLMETALSILTSVPDIFGSAQTSYMDLIKELLFISLKNSDHPNVRFSAVRATCAFLNHVGEDDAKKQFSTFVGPLLEGIEDCVVAEDDDGPLKSLVELAENMPKYLRPGVDRLIPFSIKVIADTDIADNWRQLVLELVVTLCESAPAMIRKKDQFVSPLVTQILKMMTEIDDEDDWAQQDEAEDVASDENSVAAEAALDRLACALGGKVVLPHILEATSPMLKSDQWQYRYAGLMAVSACGEGCKKTMEGFLSQIALGCLPYLQDSHPRVRFACCNALGQMSTDFAPTFQKKLHAEVLPALMMLLDDDGNPRVQGHAGAALVNFFDECPQNIILPYLGSLCQKMQAVLGSKTMELASTNRKLVLEQIITTIATIADTASNHFAPFYGMFMPNLKFIMQNAHSSELRLLRGKTIESISLIGLAVGKEVFYSDAAEIMDMLLKAQTDEGEELEADDPQVSYMISAWARMCKIIGSQFTAYLPVVMPPLLRAAQIKPEIAVVDPDETPLDEEDGWEFLPLSDQQIFGVKTAGLEDKNTACQMLVCYARELKEGFSEYTEQVVKIMVPLLKFYFHDLIRSAAAESLPYLLESVKHKGEDYVREMWNYICPDLFKALQTEMEPEILAVIMESVAACVETLGVGFIDSTQMEQLTEALRKQLKKNYDKEEERKAARKDEDYDEEVEQTIEEELDQDDYLLGKVSDIIHNLFGVYGEDFVQIFDSLTEYFVAMLAPDRPSLEHQWAICVFDDLIDYAPNSVQKYQGHFLKQLMEFLTDSTPGVRQAAAYGVGALAVKFPGPNSPYKAFCESCIPRLLNVIQGSTSREEDNVTATENCISAITKIFKYIILAENLDEATLLTWFRWLPIQEDEEEGVHIYNFLLDLVEANNPHLLGADNCNVRDIVMVLAEGILNKTIRAEEEPELMGRVETFFRSLQSNEQLWAGIVSQIPDTHKVLLSGQPT